MRKTHYQRGRDNGRHIASAALMGNRLMVTFLKDSTSSDDYVRGTLDMLAEMLVVAVGADAEPGPGDAL